MEAIDEFYDIVKSLDTCGEVVEAWRITRDETQEKAVQKLPKGTHIIDSIADHDSRTLTILTEMGDTFELAWSEHGVAAGFDCLITEGETEVVVSAVDPDGSLLLSITDSQIILTGHFDVLSMNCLGFFE